MQYELRGWGRGCRGLDRAPNGQPRITMESRGGAGATTVQWGDDSIEDSQDLLTAPPQLPPLARASCVSPLATESSRCVLSLKGVVCKEVMVVVVGLVA
eukprot:2765394-Pyramimonas_sp.AAC.2